MTTQATTQLVTPRKATKNGYWEEYPSHGDPPLTDTEVQRVEREALYAVLAEHFRGRDDLYVGADMFVYYEQGNRNKKVSPDLFVCFGVSRRTRRVYKTWEDSHGLDWVLEVVSLGTWRHDFGRKRKLYADRMGVQEYFLYDPEGIYLRQPLLGFRRQGAALKPFRAEASGRFQSEQLDLELGLTPVRRDIGRWELGFYTPEGARLLRPAEALERGRVALSREAAARAEAEAARTEAEAARTEAEKARDRESAALAEAEEELRRLRAELARLRGPVAPEP